MSACPHQVLVHGAPGALDVVRADRVIDLPVRIGGVAEIAVGGALGGGASLLEVQR